MKRKRSQLTASLIGAIVLFLPALVWGTRPIEPSKRPSWTEVEKELSAHGIQLDTLSLIEAAKSAKDQQVRVRAIRVLGLRAVAVQHMLVELLDREIVDSVLDEAALGLARLRSDRGIDEVRKRMHERADILDQAQLAGFLAELGDPSGYPYVVDTTRSGEFRTKYIGTQKLCLFIPLTAELSPRDVKPTHRLKQLSQDKNREIRKQVVTGLSLLFYTGARLGEQAGEVREILESMAHSDPDEELKKEARTSLDVMDQYWSVGPEIKN